METQHVPRGLVLGMGETASILVVDDEPDLRDTVAEYLGRQGYAVRTAEDADTARRAFEEATPTLVLLDVRMPREDGFSLARWIRQRSGAGIIMVTAANDVIDRVVGLEIGADDYVTKPFDLRELVARVRSVLRRSAERTLDGNAGGDGVSPHAGGAAANLLPFGRARLDLDGRRLLDDSEVEIPITTMEFELLAVLARHPRKALTRDQLLDLAHHGRWDPFDRSIDIRIARLRKKIEDDPAKPRFIRTVRGIGYMFDPNGG